MILKINSISNVECWFKSENRSGFGAWTLFVFRYDKEYSWSWTTSARSSAWNSFGSKSWRNDKTNSCIGNKLG